MPSGAVHHLCVPMAVLVLKGHALSNVATSAECSITLPLKPDIKHPNDYLRSKYLFDLSAVKDCTRLTGLLQSAAVRDAPPSAYV
jgi:hypothetical protein